MFRLNVPVFGWNVPVLNWTAPVFDMHHFQLAARAEVDPGRPDVAAAGLWFQVEQRQPSGSQLRDGQHLFDRPAPRKRTEASSG